MKHMHTHTHTHIHTYIQTHTYIHTHTHKHTHTVNFGRQEEEVSLMVDHEIFSRTFQFNGKEELVFGSGGTTAFKHDETGGEAAA